MTISSETKFFLGILLTTIVIITIAMIFLSRPVPTLTLPKETLITTSSHQKGNPNAKVYLVEFSDFQCPACAAFSPVVDSLVEKNKNELLFVYRHYPLANHQFAIPSALAAESASVQGKFWEATAYLFANQNKFSDTLWGTMATDLSLERTQFTKDITAQTGKSTIDQDLSLAIALNLPGTPTFFLNGALMKNINTPQDLVALVEAAITSTK